MNRMRISRESQRSIIVSKASSIEAQHMIGSLSTRHTAAL